LQNKFDTNEAFGLTSNDSTGDGPVKRDWKTPPPQLLNDLLLRLLCLAIPVVMVFAGSLRTAAQELTTPGLTKEFSASADEIRTAVLAIVRDQIVHGTKVFDKEPTLTGAVAVDSSPLFPAWSGPGAVFFKIRKDAIAPRHFAESADQGTIAVRYVIIPVTADRMRVHIDAVYVESARRKVHASDGTVEKEELKEIKDQLEANQEAAQAAADARRRQKSAELVHQTFVRQREDETSRLANAQSAEKDLEQQVRSLHHELERRVKAPGVDVKAAPFQSAATLKTLAAYSEVVILIVTPHWLGVETPEGQRGWISEEHLEQLP
jgi:hypothetical protein